MLLLHLKSGNKSSNNMQTNIPISKQNIFLPRLGKELTVWEKPLLMGIINLTPDSFYPESRYEDTDLLSKTIEEMVSAGVDIIDIGGESTRPGSDRITLDEELQRIIPAVELIRKNFDIPISVDTYKSEVAKQSLACGADIINDISGLNSDAQMANIISETGAPVIIMHMQGNPENMQKNPYYVDAVKEICEYFNERIHFAESSGIKREQIILDPGIGFGKRLQDNLEIIKHFDEFNIFKLPVLVGASRKTMIGDVLNLPVDERLEGTLAIHAIVIEKGANILRVHDVVENRRFVDMLHAIKKV